MPSFFSVRLAPGVRLSASSRGLRAHVGPRGARLHVGGGRTGVSTGVGPFTYYTSGSGSSRRAPRDAYSTGSTPAQIARAEKEQQAALVAQRLDALHQLHRASFAPLERRSAELPVLPPFKALLREEEKKAMAGVRLFSSGRREARDQARLAAELRARRLLRDAHDQRGRSQAQLDETWQRILGNDEDEVLPWLHHAFADNEAPVAAVGTEGADVSIVVLVPDEDAVPDRLPTRTPSGNVSLRSATKTQRAEWYRQLVAGHVLVSVKETLAVAAGAESVTVVAVRQRAGIEALIAGRLSREALQRSPFASESAWTILETEAADLRFRTKGVTRSLQPLDLSSEPDLSALVAAVDEAEPG